MSTDPEKIRAIAAGYAAAWNSGRPDAVASFFAENGTIVINRGAPWTGLAKVAEMAAGFDGDLADMTVCCDALRIAGDHVASIRTFTGTQRGSGKPLDVKGREEWDPDADGKAALSRGWYDSTDYGHQVGTAQA